MKIRPLPGIDLARAAVQDEAPRRLALEMMNDTGPPFSYRAVRRSMSDIFNVQSGFVTASVPTPWSVIEAQITRSAKPGNEFKANLGVARALHDYAVAEGVYGRQQAFFPLAVGIAEKVEFWTPAVLALSGRPTVVFIDPRKQTGLTPEARRFVFSVMHERIRKADPAYEDVQLGILQLTSPRTGAREVVLHADVGIPLYSFSELNEMIRGTYAIWADVLEARSAAKRRKGSSGGLFDAA